MCDAGIPIVLLHGLMGGAENWRPCAALFSTRISTRYLTFRFFEREHPIGSVEEAVQAVKRFLAEQGIARCVLAGNSFGGHVALDVALHQPDTVAGLVLTGSSGLFERGFTAIPGLNPPREWVRRKVAEVFFDPVHATEALVDEILALIADRYRVRQLIKLAKSAKQDNVAERLGQIACPTLLIWGRDDLVTPPDTAEEFHRRIPRSELVLFDRCGHTPMLEHPQLFAETLCAWWSRVVAPLPARACITA